MQHSCELLHALHAILQKHHWYSFYFSYLLPTVLLVQLLTYLSYESHYCCHAFYCCLLLQCNRIGHRESLTVMGRAKKQAKKIQRGSDGGQSASYMGICQLTDQAGRLHRRIDIKVRYNCASEHPCYWYH
jgi:hypothetical protein